MVAGAQGGARVTRRQKCCVGTWAGALITHQNPACAVLVLVWVEKECGLLGRIWWITCFPARLPEMFNVVWRALLVSLS